MNSIYQAFIFDMDGTIVETNEDICDAVNFSLKKHHFEEISYDECKGYLGNGSVRLIERAMHHERQEEFQSVFDDYYDYYRKHYNVRTRPYDGLIDSLAFAKEHGILLFIYTNKPERIALEITKKLFPEDLFSEMVGIPLGGKTKPDPEAFFKAAEPYHLDYSKVCYFGDSTTDIETAYRLHVGKMCSVLWGFQSKEMLFSYPKQPDCYLTSPKQIKNIVLDTKQH